MSKKEKNQKTSKNVKNKNTKDNTKKEKNDKVKKTVSFNNGILTITKDEPEEVVQETATTMVEEVIEDKKEESVVEETKVEEPIKEEGSTPDEELPTEDELDAEKAISINNVDITLSNKMDARIKALRDISFAPEDFGVEMWIPTEELLIDEETQRGIMISQVEKIINEFNPSSFGRITVSKRKNGFFVTNGQHRLVALRKIGIDKAPCIVIENPFEDEKDMRKFDAINFLEINQNSQAVRAIDKYRIGVSAQLEDWLNVKQVIEENGLRAGTTRNSVNALACIHRYINSSKNPITVDKKKSQMSKAIKILNETVGVPEITHVSLQAMCIIIREYVDTEITTIDKIITRFNKIEIQKLLSMAITMKNNGTQKNVVSGLAQMLVQEYNNKCRKPEERLPLDRLFDDYREPSAEGEI